jgi:hypothetical protein
MKESPRNQRTDDTVHENLINRMKGAQDHVESNPGERQPARPVVAQKHEHAADDCQSLGECDPETVVLQYGYFAKMISEAHDSDRDVYAGKNRDRDGARIRDHGSSQLGMASGCELFRLPLLVSFTRIGGDEPRDGPCSCAAIEHSSRGAWTAKGIRLIEPAS